MSNRKMSTEQGHWLLAKVGKRVLRPGGRELTNILVKEMDIQSSDHVVEFAPGMGFTANLTLQKNPKSYTGIELNEEAAGLLQKKIDAPNRIIKIASAGDTGLDAQSVDKVYGEAMLTMQADHRKSEIIREAARILKPGGYYGIHELGLVPDEMAEDKKAGIQKGLAKSIKVNARPMTVKEWETFLENEGFEIVSVHTNPMHLLKPKRIIDDEGVFRALKIGFNILTHPKYRRRIIGMKNTFNKYAEHMIAVSIIARKK